MAAPPSLPQASGSSAPETDLSLVLPKLRRLELQIGDLAGALAADYEELRRQLGGKAGLAAAEEWRLQSEITCAKLEQKADAVRVRTLEDQQQALSSTVASSSELLALQQ